MKTVLDRLNDARPPALEPFDLIDSRARAAYGAASKKDRKAADRRAEIRREVRRVSR